MTYRYITQNQINEPKDSQFDVVDFFNKREKLLNRKEVAEILGVTKETLDVWACTKRYNLPVVKVGRLAKYKYADVLKFIEERTQ